MKFFKSLTYITMAALCLLMCSCTKQNTADYGWSSWHGTYSQDLSLSIDLHFSNGNQCIVVMAEGMSISGNGKVYDVDWHSHTTFSLIDNTLPSPQICYRGSIEGDSMKLDFMDGDRVTLTVLLSLESMTIRE